MYNGTNPSALRSQQWFSEALFSLMQTKSFSKITIKELCTQADLTRQTFYQLFSSKEGMVTKLFLFRFPLRESIKRDPACVKDYLDRGSGRRQSRLLPVCRKSFV